MAIDVLTVAMLGNAGIKVLGGLADNDRAKTQARIERATNDLNAATQRVSIAQNYTGIFEKMVSDLSTQNNLLATAGVDKASTLFMKARQEHEKAFLDNKSNQERDLQNLSVQRDIANTQSRITAINRKQQNNIGMLGGMVDSFINWKSYKIGREDRVGGLK